MGLLIALTIISLWLAHLIYLLAFTEVSSSSPIMFIHIAIQTYLYTGLFITAHDAMHGQVSPNRAINNGIGRLATWLFAALSYSSLLEKHKLHHRSPGDEADPDYCTQSQNFWIWWFSFLKNYVSWWQFLTLIVIFNLIQTWVDEWNLILFWILPSVLATFQLFYFGTYLPHRLPHTEKMLPHHARTQKGPHWWAMLSCYFFGYHFEHHESPHTPWWKLYQLKNQLR
ncbi:MAG TPA: fatty acid desaturase [Prolixibacteraceae bacterium]|nr:fatty acid desaturase [Prolixibacteraceae bacterium]